MGALGACTCCARGQKPEVRGLAEIPAARDGEDADSTHAEWGHPANELWSVPAPTWYAADKTILTGGFKLYLAHVGHKPRVRPQLPINQSQSCFGQRWPTRSHSPLQLRNKNESHARK